MFKKIFTIFTFLLVITSIAIAGGKDWPQKTGGYARLLAMGNTTFIMDPYSMTVNPAWGAYYDHFIWGDIGNQQTAFGNDGFGQFGSVNFRVNKVLTLGAIFARNTFNGFAITTADPFSNLGTNDGVVQTLNGISPVAAVALDNVVELMGSFAVDGVIIGLGVSYAATTNDFTPATAGTEYETSASQIGFNLGLIAEPNKNLLIDFGASLILPSASHKPATGSEYKASQTIIAANARAFIGLSKVLKFVPGVNFMTSSGTQDNGGANPSPASQDLASFMTLAVGLGLNYRAGDFLFAGGPAFITQSRTQPSVANQTAEATTTATIFPAASFGAEWTLLDWLVGRLGYVLTTNNVTTETAVNANDVNETVVTNFFGQQGVTLGVGFRFGNFSLDAVVNEDILRQGLGNIGDNNTAPMFAYMSMSYAID